MKRRRAAIRPIVWCLAMGLVASACHSGGTTATRVAGHYQLGTLTGVSGSLDPCPAGQLCQLNFSVTCPRVRDPARGTFLILGAKPGIRGMVMFFIGGLGTNARPDVIQSDPLNASLTNDGLEVVVVRWMDPWLQSAPGEEAGPARLGCRPATTIRWAHDNLYDKLAAPAPALGACGFCITGNSGGSSQISEALTFYGLDAIVNAAVPSGGPPHAALAPGCTGQGDLAYERWASPIIDLSYGFTSNGPCMRRDSSFVPLWTRDSIDTGGGDYYYPKTRVVFIFGTADDTTGPPHGKKYLAQLRAHRSPYVKEVEIPGIGHNTDRYPAGRAAILAALLGSATSG